MIMLGFAGISLLIFLGVAYSLFADKVYEQDIDKVNDFGFSIQNEIILASEVHDGYTRVITMPNKLDGLDYNIYDSGGFLFVTYSKGDVLFLLPEYYGSISKGTLTIKNVEGKVEIS